MHSADYAAMTLADAMLRKHEGTRQFPYKCTEGFTTIGVGRNLDTRGLRSDEIELMLANDIEHCVDDLNTYPWWDGLSSRRKASLIDLRFCVGPQGFRGFRKMIAALEVGDHPEAAAQILDSKFATQTGYRATELSDALRQG